VRASDHQRRIQRWRRLLLGGIATVLAALVGLYLFGRAGRESGRPIAAPQGADREGITLEGEGFDYTVSQGEQPLFRIRGDRIRSDREQNVELEGVEITYFRADGSSYVLKGRSAVYNRQTHEARLEGEVRMASAKGMELETSALTLTDGGRELLSEAPVRFRFGEDLGGNAGHLRAQLRRELFVLGGGVTVNSRSGAPTPLSLRAQRVALERRERLLRAEGNVRLTHGASSVEARRVAALFAEDERTLRSVAARWEVSGELVPASGRGTPVELGGYRLAADLDPTGKNVSQVELEGGEGRPARLVTAAPRGGERRLRAGRISARLEEGELHSAVATGGVELQEPAVGDGTLRSAEASQAEAQFGAGGALVAVTLTGDVRLAGPDLRATGQRAYVEQAGGRAELFGKRGGVDAMAANQRGELRAPHLVYTRANGVLHADGGVKAQLAARDGSAVAGVALGSEGGPIRVEAAEANWQEEPPTFSFAGQVRAWRGDNLLTAEQLRGNERNGELSASGGVRTLWVLTGEEDAAAAKGAEPPIEVAAATLLYRRDQGELLYGGGVRVTQEKRVLTCRDARVELDAEQQARRMTCAGQARLDDAAAGRRVTGDVADYDLQGKTITVAGDPVTLDDQVRGVARGRQLVYDVASGSVRLLAEEPAAPGSAA
jgi:LPS export ABC transporter protein LptC